MRAERGTITLRTNTLGTWTEFDEFIADPDLIRRYAEATNERDLRYRTGHLVPPLFAVLLLRPVVIEVLRQVEPKGAGLLPSVHGEHDIFFHHPIAAGMILRSRGAPIGVHLRSSGTTLVVKFETRTEGGDTVNTQYLTAFYRGLAATQGAGDPGATASDDGRRQGQGARHHRDGADRRGPDLPIRRRLRRLHLLSRGSGAGASGGPPGDYRPRPVHSRFRHSRGDGPGHKRGRDRLKRLAARFTRPVLPGHAVTTSVWTGGEPDSYLFETSDPAGQPVIRHGYAEWAD